MAVFYLVAAGVLVKYKTGRYLVILFLTNYFAFFVLGFYGSCWLQIVNTTKVVGFVCVLCDGVLCFFVRCDNDIPGNCY